MTVTSRLVTAEDLLAIDDDYRYDLIRGELYRMSPAGAEHGGLAFAFGLALGNFVSEQGLGRLFAAETGFKLERDPDTVLAPDISFVSADRLPAAGLPRGFLELPPDLMIEIASPSQSRPSVERKVVEYLDAGVPLAWVAWLTRRAVSVHRSGREMLALGIGDILDGEDVLPGFRLPLVELFRALP
jgi:Uma2 family endonuclease